MRNDTVLAVSGLLGLVALCFELHRVAAPFLWQPDTVRFLTSAELTSLVWWSGPLFCLFFTVIRPNRRD